jgi:predicted ATPase
MLYIKDVPRIVLRARTVSPTFHVADETLEITSAATRMMTGELSKAALVADPFVAIRLNVYVASTSSPWILQPVEALVQLAPPGFAVTV